MYDITMNQSVSPVQVSVKSELGGPDHRGNITDYIVLIFLRKLSLRVSWILVALTLSFLRASESDGGLASKLFVLSLRLQILIQLRNSMMLLREVEPQSPIPQGQVL